MASPEKLSKALEALKALVELSPAPDEPGLSSKRKSSLCILIAETICSPDAKSANSFNNLLTSSIDALFLMCNDTDSNVRMTADECLNRIIRSLMMDGLVARVNMELHTELQKNRSSRSVRAALIKISQLAHTIRPNKRKAYMENLFACILLIAKRKEDSVLETLALSLEKVLISLGCFMTDSEVKSLLQVFMANIDNENAVFRRTGAASILAVCLNCNKSQFFIIHTINTLLERVLPVKEELSMHTIVGVLNCIRGLLPHIEGQSTEVVMRGSFGLKRQQKKESNLSIDSLLQVFELCLHWSGHRDHNVVTAVLETLNELLTSPPRPLLSVLLSRQGLSRSRIHSPIAWKLSTRTLSDISVATTVPHSEDINLLDSEDLSVPLKTNLSIWFEEGSSKEGSHPSILSSIGLPSLNQESLSDFPDSESVLSEDYGNFSLNAILSKTPEPDLDFMIHDSPSPPPETSVQTIMWDIGEVTDSQQPVLLYTARRIVTGFLVPESACVRTSVRCLAISCLSHVLRLSPTTFFQPVDKNGVSTPQGFSHVCDIICFAEDSDQQVRGLMRLLIGQLIHSFFSQALYQPLFTEPTSEKNVSLQTLIDILISGIQDESSVCIRHSLSGLLLSLSHILESSHHMLATPILDTLLTVATNPYWLVKVKLIEVICSLPFDCVFYVKQNPDYQTKVFAIIVEMFLADEDNRVRKITANCLPKLVMNLYFPIDFGIDDVVVARGINISSKIAIYSSYKGCGKEGFYTMLENTLSRVIDVLISTLMASSSKNLSLGCIEALCQLSQEYPPRLYPFSWHSSTPDSENEDSAASGLFSIVVNLLTKSPVSLDLECHQWLLELASNIFMGHISHQTEKTNLPEKNSKLKEITEEFLTHLMRILYIYTRVMEDNPQIRSSLASPLRKRTIRSTSPSKAITSTPEKESEKEDKGRFVGPYGNIIHCQKLHEIIRSGYTNYKLSLDQGPSEKFLSLIRHTLTSLEMLLLSKNIIETEKLLEELLQYFRVSFILDSECTVKAINQLLRNLFESTYMLSVRPNLTNASSTLEPFPIGYYRNLIEKPLVHIMKLCQQPSDKSESTSEEEGNDKVKVTLSQSQREYLASRIKLFEGIVIQSLKEYTLTCNVRLQAQVLTLLTLLAQLKVNYCLLDSDQIFIQYVLKQFEFLEAGQLSGAEVLIPSIFKFLVHLSNEKNHSKPVIAMPKIIQLCDGLMASGQNPVTHSIPALMPVVEHVFFKNTNPVDLKELETQKEVLLVMLLRLAEHPQVLDLIYKLLKEGSTDEETRCRWYKQSLDVILPLLHESRFLYVDVRLLHSLFTLDSFNLCPPLCSLLMLLFSPQHESERVGDWLGVVTVTLLSISTHKEDRVLLELEQMNLYVREEGDDPLKVNTVSKTLRPQSLLAKQLFRIIMTSVLKLETLVQSQNKDEDCTELEKMFSNFLLCCILMLKPDRFGQVSKSVCTLMNESSEMADVKSRYEHIAHLCQMPVLLWAQLMAVVGHSPRHSWAPFMQTLHTQFSNSLSNDKLSLNEEMLRRGTIMLYAEYLSRNENKTDLLRWLLSDYIDDIIWHCHEPPIEKLLVSIYSSVRNSQLLLKATSRCFTNMEPVFTHRLLHTLEYIHPDFSGSVLKCVALSLSEYKNIAVARLAAVFCSRTVEYILTSEKMTVKEQLTEEEVRSIFKRLSQNQRQFKRYNALIMLLNKFGKQFYNISLCHFNDCVKPVTPGHIRSIKLDKTWFFYQVKEKCCSGSVTDTRKCAYLLNQLGTEDLELVMSSKQFDINILQHCFSLQPQVEGKENSHLSSPLFLCAQKILLKSVKEVNGLCHNIYEVSNKIENGKHDLQYFESESFTKMFFALVPAVKSCINSLKRTSLCQESVLEKGDCDALYKFCIFSFQVINWIATGHGRRMDWPSKLQDLLECCGASLQLPFIASQLTFQTIANICLALSAVFKFITKQEVPLKVYNPIAASEAASSEPPVVVETALRITSLLSLMDYNSTNIPNHIFHRSRCIGISVGRTEKLNWLCRIPIEAWQVPLDSSTPPTIAPHLLHDTDILSQIVSRIRLLCWRSKLEFEEAWVCLLGALSPNPDPEDEVASIMQANSLAIDGITWLILSSLRCDSNSDNSITYLHTPRHKNEKLSTLKCWTRLAEMNEKVCKKLARLSGHCGIRLLRIDHRPNLDRLNSFSRYGFGQMSVSYLQSQIKPEAKENEEVESVLQKHKLWLKENGIDLQSCVQFILDLFSHLLLNNSITLNVQVSMIKSIVCISDVFMERAHFEWMLNSLIDELKSQQAHDEIMHQYLVIGISKAAAVLGHFEGEQSEKIFLLVEGAMKSQFVPLREAGLEGMLYLLQAVLNIEDKAKAEEDKEKFKAGDFKQRAIQCSTDFIQKNFIDEPLKHDGNLLLAISLAFFILEFYPGSMPDSQQLIKGLITLAKSSDNSQLYTAVLQGFERLVLTGDLNELNKQVTHMALERFNQLDPKISIPALQLLIACIYSDSELDVKVDESEPWSIEIMEKVTALFDRIRRGYPMEVEIVCAILPAILSDFFSASDILTKVIGEFLSPNQPHKRNMADMVFQVFKQACTEQQLSLLQDWVVYSLRNLTQNLPAMMGAWALSCFFISASINPSLKAIFPVIQSRIRQCEYEDREILCLAALDFHSQLDPKQKKIFLDSIQNSSSSPFIDIFLCLSHTSSTEVDEVLILKL